MDKEFYYIWIRQFPRMTHKKIQKLLVKYNVGTLEELYNLEVSEVSGQGEKIAAQEMFDKLKKSNIQIIGRYEKNYPPALLNLAYPPLCIFVKGNTKILYEKIVGIVGARECTEYGKKVSYTFARKLARKGFVIVSGLAKGIDSYAHKGAVYASTASTIAVVGTGLDMCYPRENIYLEEQILKSGGCIVSEYLFGEGPERKHFPMRNRIIAALCNKLIVIEAKRKSGALITVDLALELGKDVYAVPGDITSNTSVGTNELIKEGCSLIDSVDNFL